MGYLRRTLNYPESTTLFDPALIMSLVDHVATNVETPRIDSGYSFEKEFTEMISMNP